MKKIVTALSFMLIVFMLSCNKNDDGSSKSGSNAFDGMYKGQTYYNNTAIGTWSMTIQNSAVLGTYIQDGETANIKGTVAASGKLNLSIDYPDGEKITVDATISNGIITGTWYNGDGMSGTLSGEKEDEGSNSNQLDGSYSGTATLNGVPAANWNFVIFNNRVSGTFTDVTGVAFIIGNANSTGTTTIEIVYDNGSIVNAALQISEGNVTGTWSADGNSGDVTGKKDNNNNTNKYDGTYEGEAFMDGEGIGSWTMIVKDNIAEGTYSGEEASGGVKGIVTSTGAVKFNAYQEEDFVVNVKASINGNNVTGSWSNNDGESGILSGSKK